MLINKIIVDINNIKMKFKLFKIRKLMKKFKRRRIKVKLKVKMTKKRKLMMKKRKKKKKKRKKKNKMKKFCKILKEMHKLKLKLTLRMMKAMILKHRIQII